MNFKREFEGHGVKYGGFETMHFRKLRGHGDNVVCFSIWSHDDEGWKNAKKEKLGCSERIWMEEEEE